MRKQKTIIIILTVFVVALLTVFGLEYYNVIDLFKCPVCMDNCQTPHIEPKKFDGRLINKTAMLLNGSTEWHYDLPKTTYLDDLFKDYKVNNEEISYLILVNSSRAQYDYTKITEQSVIDLYGLESIKNYPPEFVYNDTYKYNYKKLFGKEGASTTKKFEHCPSPRYDSNLNGYLIVNECGNVSFSNYIVYISDVNEYEDYATVNIKVGLAELIPEEDDKWNLYSDVDKKTLIEKVDGSNKELKDLSQFSEYAITFDKKIIDDNNIKDYYFNKIERVK